MLRTAVAIRYNYSVGDELSIESPDDFIGRVVISQTARHDGHDGFRQCNGCGLGELLSELVQGN